MFTRKVVTDGKKSSHPQPGFPRAAMASIPATVGLDPIIVLMDEPPPRQLPLNMRSCLTSNSLLELTECTYNATGSTRVSFAPTCGGVEPDRWQVTLAECLQYRKRRQRYVH